MYPVFAFLLFCQKNMATDYLNKKNINSIRLLDRFLRRKKGKEKEKKKTRNLSCILVRSSVGSN